MAGPKGEAEARNPRGTGGGALLVMDTATVGVLLRWNVPANR